MKASVIVACIVGLVVLFVWVNAQEELVVLEYKYQPGEVMKYQMTGKGTGTMSMSGMENQNFGMFTAGSMPLSLDLQGYLVMSTKNVDTDGTAELEMTFDKLIENMEMMGQKIAIKIEQGGYEMSVNNQPMFSSKSAGIPLPFFGKPITMKISKTGEMLDFSGMEWLEELMPNLGKSMDFNDMTKNMQTVFPDHPVKIGEVWSSTTQFKLPNMKTKPINFMTESSLLGIETVAGKRYAIINTFEKMDIKDWKLDIFDSEKSKGAMPEMNFKRMEQMMFGKVIHSLDAGQTTKTEYTQNMNMEMNMKMAMPNQKKPLDMTMKMDIAMNIVMELIK